MTRNIKTTTLTTTTLTTTLMTTLGALTFGLAAGCVGAAPETVVHNGSGDEEGAGSGDSDSSSGTDSKADGQGGGSGAIGFEIPAGQAWKVLDHDYQVQQTGYWCGPAATRMALSTQLAAPPSQQTLANQLPTTTNGTDTIMQVTNTLNRHIGARYATVQMPNDPPTAAQRDQLWRDVTLSVDAGHGMVANIVAPATNHPPGYPNYTIYHYFAVLGYNLETRQVYIGDSANFSNIQHYWLSFDQLATLIPPKGYSTYRCGVGRTRGQIDERYQSFGGCNSFLGPALTDERTTPDGVGKYNVFRNGSIYWSPNTGAFEVHGAIRDKYSELGWEAGLLGYPISNETTTPDGIGRFSVFEGGSIYWSPSTGAHEVHGAIRDRYKQTGWEAGPLGYPTSDEYAVPGGRRSDFQNGSITWNDAESTTTVEMN